MLDIKVIRESPDEIKSKLKYRLKDPEIIDKILELDEKRKKIQYENDQLKSKRNQASAEISKLQDSSLKEEKISETKRINDQISTLQESQKALEKEQKDLMLLIPNLPDKRSPPGEDDSVHTLYKEIGTAKKPEFNFKPKTHHELLEAKNLLDTVASAKMTGSGFYVSRGDFARLERALITYCLDFHNENNLTEVQTPLMVNEEAITGTGQLPKFEDDVYKLREGYYLIPTSEVSLVAQHREEIFQQDQLPIRYCAQTPCFRVESGRHGTQDRGIFRVHQFNKVEMVTFCTHEQQEDELQFMLKNTTQLLENLELPYRIITLSQGDMGFQSSVTFDFELWSPALDRWMETSSVSTCGDFQGRRQNTKYRSSDGNKFVCTLNGSGLAMTRLLISVIENNQNEDGSINIPKVLQPYMGNKTKIE